MGFSQAAAHARVPKDVRIARSLTGPFGCCLPHGQKLAATQAGRRQGTRLFSSGAKIDQPALAQRSNGRR